VKRRHVAIAAGRFLLDALSGRLGVPIMVMGYVTFSVLLLGYVSTQVYTHSLMESVERRKREELALREEIGVLTAQYATRTSKSRVSNLCEGKMGMVSASMNDIVRVGIDDGALPASPESKPAIQVEDVLGEDMGDLSQVINE
jgi:hypothetical protein